MTCNNLIYGFDGMTEQPKRESFTTTNGDVTIREWRGPRDKSKPLIAALRAVNGIKYDISGGPDCVVTATFGDDAGGGGGSTDNDRETWNLSIEILQLPLATMKYYNSNVDVDKVIGWISYYLDKQGTRVAEFATNGRGPEILLADIAGYTDLSAGNKTICQNYLTQRLKGQDTYEDTIPVITQNISRAKSSNVKHSQANAGRKVNYADIEVDAGVPWDEPKYIGWNDVEYAYEWYKEHPDITDDGIRWTIQQRWKGFWKLSNVMYGGTGFP